MPEGEGQCGAGEELAVVVLHHVGSGGVAQREKKAEAAADAEETDGGDRGEVDGRDWLGVMDAEKRADGRRDEAGGKDHALGCVAPRERAGPDDVGRETEDAGKAGKIADGIAGVPSGARGMHSNDDAEEADEGSETAAKVEGFAEEEGGEEDGDYGGAEDQDVEECQGNVAEGDDDAEIVAEVEAGAQRLLAGRARPQGTEVAAQKGVGEKKDDFCETDKGEDFIAGHAEGAGELETGIGKDPEGVGGESESDGDAGGDGGSRAMPLPDDDGGGVDFVVRVELVRCCDGGLPQFFISRSSYLLMPTRTRDSSLTGSGSGRAMAPVFAGGVGFRGTG